MSSPQNSIEARTQEVGRITTHFDPLAFEESLERVLERLSTVTVTALKRGALINLDTEQCEYRDLTLALAQRGLDRAEADSGHRLGVVIQDYLREGEYALTEGVYSRSPAQLEESIRRFDVGNLYLNQPITGAIVGRQPFGGYRLSGLGTKAGGPDYLTQLLLPGVISENTARYGIPLE